jgi:peptidoglycan/LPS O-acetylase OafA/YrhL
MTNDSRHILSLDALRGIAAVAVLLIHVGWVTGDKELARFGYLAVDLFFVMSGFVIGRAYEHKLLAGMSWSRFMLLRIARLYPSMFLGLLFGVLAYFILPHGTYRMGWHSIGHFLLIPDFSAEVMFPLNGVLWSLFYELLINALHSLVVRRLSTFTLVVFVASMGVAWWLVARQTGNWGGGDWNGGSFLGGFARIGWTYGFGVLLHRMTADRWRVPAIVPIAVASLVLLVPNVGFVTWRVPLTVFLLLPLSVALAVGSDIPPRGRGLARGLGAISYPLYAIHHPLLFIIASRFEITTGARRAAVAVALVAVAALVEYVYDSPIRKRLLALLASRAEERPVKLAAELSHHG